jgi:hypothetical protein
MTTFGGPAGGASGREPPQAENVKIDNRTASSFISKGIEVLLRLSKQSTKYDLTIRSFDSHDGLFYPCRDQQGNIPVKGALRGLLDDLLDA